MIAGDTPQLTGTDIAKVRCAEIEQSVHEIGCDEWVSIDDLDLAEADPMLFMDHAVLTQSAQGLTEQSAALVGKLLTGEEGLELRNDEFAAPASLAEWFEATYSRARSGRTSGKGLHPHSAAKSCDEWKQQMSNAQTSTNDSSDDSEGFALEPGALDEWG